jgi:hypothetical protein
VGRHAEDADERAVHRAAYEFLVPIIKGWSTEISIDVANLGIQVHGGVGYIEETGAAQLLRDARILTIYEGTTAIQANDLVGRKTLRDRGATVNWLLDRIDATLSELQVLAGNATPAIDATHRHLLAGRHALAQSVAFLLTHADGHPNAVYGAGVPYLKLCGVVLGGWQMARALLASLKKQNLDPDFHLAKIATAHFFAVHVLPQAHAYATAIRSPEAIDAALALNPSQF